MTEAKAALKGARTVPQRPIRPRELEDPLNYHVYHPLAWQLARLLARTPLTPNMVSVAGGITVVIAGICYTELAWPVSALLGMALHMAWHVIDGADGDLARMTGRTSPRGEMIDGLCDYSSHIVLYILLAMFLEGQIGWIAWPIAILAGVAHAIQSNHVEAQRRFYLYWIYGKPWLNNQRGDTGGLFGWLVTQYLRVAAGMTPHALQIDAAITAAKGDPARLEALRAPIRAEAGRLLKIEKMLGPNQRAIVLGAAMILTNSPLAYFAFGGLWLTALLAFSVAAHNAAARRIAERVAALA